MSKYSREEAEQLSHPSLSGFDPDVIPYQGELFDLVRGDWDYTKGNLEILLSGSYGSAKSIAMAHLAITHCLENDRARVCLARRSMPDLKDTIFKEIIEHLENDESEDALVEGEDYIATPTRGYIKFLSTNSEIISRSWADKKYKKGRSLKLSMLIFEELTENDFKDKAAFDTLKARLRRLPHVKENVLIAATNPDEPDHWVYDYWMVKKEPYKKVFYSVTEDNPFLDPVYVEQLRHGMTREEADRFLRGKWLSILGKGIYYAYDPAYNFRPDEIYEINPKFPICIMHDFNIGKDKPMSAAVGQYIDGTFHVKKTYIVKGFRTKDMMDEMAEDGVFEHPCEFYVYGDETGNHNDTRSNLSDWEIIEQFLSKYQRKSDKSKLKFSMEIPTKNPEIKARHNKVNAAFCNDLEERRLFIYKEAAAADEGFRLTKLKKGSVFQEDDSYENQHVTTAIGYWVHEISVNGFGTYVLNI
jgi:PBSX family phage terminase large subunit